MPNELLLHARGFTWGFGRYWADFGDPRHAIHISLPKGWDILFWK